MDEMAIDTSPFQTKNNSKLDIPTLEEVYGLENALEELNNTH